MHSTKIPHQVRDDEKVMRDDEKSGAGVPYIVALKKNCTIDPDSTDGNNNPMSCIYGIYDYNGTRLPNKDGEDITSINGARISTKCIMKIGTVCIGSKAIPLANRRAISYLDCESKYLGKLTSSCLSKRNDDYWLGAKVACDELGLSLPTLTDLAALNTGIFNGQYSSEKLQAAADKLGVSGSSFDLWSDAEFETDNAYYRNFYPTRSGENTHRRSDTYPQVICIGD